VTRYSQPSVYGIVCRLTVEVNTKFAPMLSITLVAFKRPAYTSQALEALSCCRGLRRFERLFISIDPGFDAVGAICREWGKRLPIAVEVTVNAEPLGVAGNPLRAYSRAFDEAGSDFNVAIEDDAVLSPDALELALWFYERRATASRYSFLNLCDHYDYRGEGRNKRAVLDSPELLAETSNLSAPFAWCLPRREWGFVKANWNANSRSIPGWDWSLRFAMRMESKIALTPVLSRCRNIGRLDPTNETKETFWVQTGLRHSDGRYTGEYTVVNPIEDHELRRIDKWMLPELPRYFSTRR
jgi:hypothetical protein